MAHLIYSRLEEREYMPNKAVFTFYSGHKLIASNTDTNTQDMLIGCYYWVSFDTQSKMIISVTELENSDKLSIQAKIKNLNQSSDKLFACVEKLSKAERTQFMQAIGFTASTAFAVVNGIQAVNALFAWEPINLCLGLALTAGSSLYSQSLYEQLSESQKLTASLLNNFNNHFLIYQATIKRYVPKQYSDNVIADVRYTTFISRLRHSLPTIDLSKFTNSEVAFA